MRWGIDTAETVLRASGTSIPKYIRVDIPHGNASAIRLLDREGLKPVRYFHNLHKDLAAGSPASANQQAR